MTGRYITSGTCSKEISFEIEGGIVRNVVFYSGCNGNLKGISSLVEGMEVHDVIKKLNGITCGVKPTSCPDQLAHALAEALDKHPDA